jgi:hypothetical protein
VSNPVTRATGASRWSKASSTIRATISAPNPAVSGASCTTTARPVSRTAVAIASMSSGTSVRTSTTLTSVPRSDAACAAASARGIMAPQANTVQSEPSRTVFARPIGTAPLPFPSEPPSVASVFAQYRLFGSRKITGSGSAIEARSRPNASGGFDGTTTLSPAVCA